MSTLRWPDALPTLRSDGLTLRPWRSTDADAVFVAYQDPDIVRWTRVAVPYQWEQAAKYVGTDPADGWANKTRAGFAVVDGDDVDGAVVGSVALVRMNPEIGVTEVGYWVGPWARHRGIARRAAAEATRWAFEDLGFARVELRAAVENSASRRVAEHLGFTLEGIMRSSVPGRTGRFDVALYSRLPSDDPLF